MIGCLGVVYLVLFRLRASLYQFWDAKINKLF